MTRLGEVPPEMQSLIGSKLSIRDEAAMRAADPAINYSPDESQASWEKSIGPEPTLLQLGQFARHGISPHTPALAEALLKLRDPKYREEILSKLRVLTPDLPESESMASVLRSYRHADEYPIHDAATEKESGLSELELARAHAIRSGAHERSELEEATRASDALTRFHLLHRPDMDVMLLAHLVENSDDQKEFGEVLRVVGADTEALKELANVVRSSDAVKTLARHLAIDGAGLDALADNMDKHRSRFTDQDRKELTTLFAHNRRSPSTLIFALTIDARDPADRLALLQHDNLREKALYSLACDSFDPAEQVLIRAHPLANARTHKLLDVHQAPPRDRPFEVASPFAYRGP